MLRFVCFLHQEENKEINKEVLTIDGIERNKSVNKKIMRVIFTKCVSVTPAFRLKQ